MDNYLEGMPRAEERTETYTCPACGTIYDVSGAWELGSWAPYDEEYGLACPECGWEDPEVEPWEVLKELVAKYGVDSGEVRDFIDTWAVVGADLPEPNPEDIRMSLSTHYNRPKKRSNEAQINEEAMAEAWWQSLGNPIPPKGSPMYEKMMQDFYRNLSTEKEFKPLMERR